MWRKGLASIALLAAFLTMSQAPLAYAVTQPTPPTGTTTTTTTPVTAPVTPGATAQPTPTAAQPAAGANTSLTQLPEIECGGTGLGLKWIICPIMKTIYRGIYVMFDHFIKPMLDISPLSFKATDPLMIVWKAFRDLTNALLVIIFLFVIFGNATAIGIDAYSFKKAIPRLIVAAVGIQISYFITAFLVDLGNVLGAGIQGLANSAFLDQIGRQLTPNAQSWSSPAELGTNVIILGVAGIIVNAFELWGFFLPLILVVGFAVMSFLLSIFARQLIISILIVISPLAIAAWVLPNTEKYFKLWWENLFKAIMMYPIIMLILIMGNTVAIIGHAAGGSKEIMAMFGPLIAFMMIPGAFKWSGNITAGITSKIRERTTGYGKKVSEPLRANINEGRKERGFLNAIDKHNQFGSVGRTIGRFNAAGVGGLLPTRQTKRRIASGGQAAHHALVHDSQDALLSEDIVSNADLYKLVLDYFNGAKTHKGLELTPYMAEAAMETMGKQGGNVELARLYDGDRSLVDGTLDPNGWQGLYDHDGQQFRNFSVATADKTRELWRRGIAIPHGSTYVKSLVHTVHGRGDGAIDGLKGEEFANLHGSASAIIMKQLLGTAPGRDKAKQNYVSSLVNIGQSTDRRGRVAKELLFATKQNAAAFAGTVVNVPGVGPMDGQDFINTYIVGNPANGAQGMEMLGVKET
jgi:hypothetical protein